MKFRRQPKHEVHIDVTNFIDILLLLLIFFMISTTMTKEGHLKLSLPQAEGSTAQGPVDRIEVIVDTKGSYALNGQQLINNQLATLISAIEKLALTDKKTPFIVTADANVPYQHVVTVMDAAGKTGFTNIQITTKNPSAPQAGAPAGTPPPPNSSPVNPAPAPAP